MSKQYRKICIIFALLLLGNIDSQEQKYGESTLKVFVIHSPSRVSQLTQEMEDLENLRDKLTSELDKVNQRPIDWQLGLGFMDVMDIVQLLAAMGPGSIPEGKLHKLKVFFKVTDIAIEAKKGSYAIAKGRDIEGMKGIVTAFAKSREHLRYIPGLNDASQLILGLSAKSMELSVQTIRTIFEWRDNRDKKKLATNMASVADILVNMEKEFPKFFNKIPHIKKAKRVVNYTGLAVLGWHLLKSLRAARFAFTMKKRARELLVDKINDITARIEYKGLELNHLVDYRQKFLTKTTELTQYQKKYQNAYKQMAEYKRKYEIAHQVMLEYQRSYEQADRERIYQSIEYKNMQKEKERYKSQYIESRKQFSHENSQLKKKLAGLETKFRQYKQTKSAAETNELSSDYTSSDIEIKPSRALRQLEKIYQTGSWPE